VSHTHLINKGSHKNKFAILSVEAPVWQGANEQEYQDIPSFCNVAMRDASALSSLTSALGLANVIQFEFFSDYLTEIIV